MGERLEIGWIIGRADWAYKNLMKHNIKALSDYKHTVNDKTADVVVAMSLAGLEDLDKSKTILHLDSGRTGL